MITLDLAQQLRAGGVEWDPQPGDRFVIVDRDMDDDVFVVSNMVVDVHDLPGGRVIGFNGTVEWALDSVEADEVVWLPRESQLRDLLGEAFVRLESVPPGLVVVTRSGAEEHRYADVDAERAYARAVLALIGAPGA
jgi:hypothetical protein